jgi:tetratricopeptide (TPR) repeat protein
MRTSRNGLSALGRVPATGGRVLSAIVLALGLGTSLAAQQRSESREPRAESVDSTAFYRALDLEGAGKYREAAVLFRQSLRGPTGVSALLGLERVYAELRLTDSLLAPLDSLIQGNPREPIFRAVQLRSLQTLGRDADANASFERWVREVPKDPSPYREYARLLLQRGQAARADSVLLRARAQLGGTGDLNLEIAQARAAMGQWEESARAWRAALGTAPYLEQAAAYALAPAPTTVRDAIRSQFFAPPLVVASRRALATLEAAWGSPANGWIALRDLPADSSAAAAWMDFAQRAEAEERWTHAREALTAVLRWRPSADISLRAAVASLNSGDPGGALALAPLTSGGADSARVARTLLPVHVRALAALGRPASAERLVSSYERWLTPTNRAALARSIAFGWVRVGDMSRARGALTVAGPDADSSDAAGWLALYAGDIKTARRLLRSGGDASPELALALALVARVKADSALPLGQAFLTLARGDTASAATALAESAERLPEVASLLFYTAAQLRLALKDEAQAIPLWKRVVEQYASSAEAPAAELEWARALRRRGAAAEAAQRLEHLILTYPQSALVPQARRDLEIVRNTIPATP